YWWLADPNRAIDLRERAYAGFRKQGDVGRAARIALWLSREYGEVQRNEPAANGWLARASSIIESSPSSAGHGWLALQRSSRAIEPSEVERLAREALALARANGDPDLEIRSLSRLALALAGQGRVAEGVTSFDEAMAAATGGEATTLDTVGEACCDGMILTEVVGDAGRLEKWAAVMMEFMQKHQYGPLVAFCGSCCGELFALNGDMPGAERELLNAIRQLEESGQHSRCVHPAVKLAELRVLQGRYEDAERLLAGYEGLPEAARAQVALALARGQTAVAAAILERRLNALGSDSLLTLPLLVQLVQVRVAKKDPEGVRTAAARLLALASETGELRVAAEAARALGHAHLAAGSADDARADLERALELFTKLRLPLEIARTRMLLAQVLPPDVAMSDAQAALSAFERLGATREADAAAAVMRALGGSARTGPKGYGTLSKREEDVLALLAEGLTNAEIAARLYISTKTAGNHVSNILMKLSLRSRAEAATFAARRGT
ncbi:MAG: LuxR C-terminal-related transcriptional regulator, partial [Actinomycetota bacterium]